MPARTRALATDIDEQTGIGDVYLEGLRRAQLRLALTVLALMAAAIGGFPVLLALIPTTRTMTVAGIPLPWLVLGVLVYPAAWLLARGYVRQAERFEAEFAAIVEAGRDDG
ncbi:membrane protein [Knoellia sinensis KCTC 19936]|uniref:Membrane protein n=2 Tax=Knoellia TaxID=136099 RepID=A0A0A0J5S8_9MICO|nr:membrane protein [Knoellia sinensis KCTC 19936]